MSLYQAFHQLFQLIWLLFLARILLSWFPSVDWYKQPFKFIYDATEPVFAPFRRLIPPVSGIDFSPIIVFIFLGMVERFLLGLFML